MKYRTKLVSKKEVANGTMEFRFEKPEGFAFAAGQNCDWTIVNPPETDAEGNTRAFTIVVPPQDPNIALATRMRDTAFKRTLKNAEPGLEMEVDGPMGSFTLHENIARPAIFLAGGIGVTPFHSIVHDAAERKLSHKIFLFYSNRTKGDAPYFDELSALESQNPNYKFIPTLTDDVSDWNGERGYIAKDMLDRHVPERATAVYYLAGPPAMVAAMRTMLNGAGVSNDDIRTEEFSGY